MPLRPPYAFIPKEKPMLHFTWVRHNSPFAVHTVDIGQRQGSSDFGKCFYRWLYQHPSHLIQSSSSHPWLPVRIPSETLRIPQANYIIISGDGTKASVFFKAPQVMLVCIQGQEGLTERISGEPVGQACGVCRSCGKKKKKHAPYLRALS